MKIDPYKHKERYFSWKNALQGQINGLSKDNSETILKYLFDMESGLNVSNKSAKGARSFTRLNNIRQRLVFLAREFESVLQVKDIREITEEQLFKFFNDMRNGQIKRRDGTEYQSVSDFVRIFKAFWHWWMKINKKNGIDILDLTMDLDTSNTKPKWVYLTEEQVKKLADNSSPYYRSLIWFLYDTGIRAPTELMNIRVSDFYNDFKEVQIREETSKTFGRRIKLMLCSELIKEHVRTNKLGEEDPLFQTIPNAVNKYLQRLAKKQFGDNISEAGQKYSQLTMYDFRHCSCCYWLPRYKSESALKYRFGWKKSDKIHYYSELLGMKDTISQEDLLVDTTKTEIEKRLTETERENNMLKDKMAYMENKMEEIGKLTDILFGKMSGRD